MLPKRVLFLAAALLLSGVPACGPATPEDPPRNLLVFVIDTLRADRVGAYGNESARTPNLDALARDGVLFEHAFAPSFHTAASHASLFTSTYPATHGVWNQVHRDNGKTSRPVLAPTNVTLAETLRDAGFQTAAIADGGWVTRKRGLLQGFRKVDSATRGTANRVNAALRWLRGIDTEQPFFLFVHTYEVHAPYVPPQGLEGEFAGDYAGPLRDALVEARRFRRERKVEHPLSDLHRMFFQPRLVDPTPEDVAFMLALYDTELAIVDREFGRLRERMEARGLWDDTLVVVTADHGEEFFEHGRWDHTQLHREVLHIPLIIRDPRGPAGVRRTELVDLVDVMPTALAALEVPAPATGVGRTLSLRSAPRAPSERSVIAEVDAGGTRGLTVRSAGFRAIFLGEELDSVEVFDVNADPQERHDIADSARARDFVTNARAAADEHLAAARSHRKRHGLGPRIERGQELTSEESEQLRMLGYIE